MIKTSRKRQANLKLNSDVGSTKAVLEPWGVGTATYGLHRYVRLWRVWFSSSLLRDGVYKSESLGLEWGIIFHETDQFVEDFSLD